MPRTVHTSSVEARTSDELNLARRKFLRLFPFGVFVAIASTISANAIRFLRPRSGVPGSAMNSQQWVEVAPLSELTGDQPLLRQVEVEHDAGWTSVKAEQQVFVLPQQNNRVVSAVCPHEGCTVEWRAEARNFFCPCHDSRFTADGARLSGPARHALDELPARVENGMLKIQTPTNGATD